MALRNAIHGAGAVAYGTDLWFADPAHLSLERREQKMLDGAVDHLRDQRKPRNAGRIVAELPFGFWTGLLNAPYDAQLWSAKPTLGLLDATFPHVPRTYRSRKRLSRKLNDVRRLRNRVFHYEPVWSLTSPTLRERHAEILEVTGWISPTLRATVELVDRFPDVHGQGRAAYRGLLTDLLATWSP